jgi:hypothetical protein
MSKTNITAALIWGFLFISLLLSVALIMNGCNKSRRTNVVTVTEVIRANVFVAPEGSIVRVSTTNDVGETVEFVGEVTFVGTDRLTLSVTNGDTVTSVDILYVNILDYEVIAIPTWDPPEDEETPEEEDEVHKNCRYLYNRLHRLWFLHGIRECLEEGGTLQIKTTNENSRVRFIFVCKNDH